MGPCAPGFKKSERACRVVSPSSSAGSGTVTDPVAPSAGSVELDKNLPFLGTLLKKEQDIVAFADQSAGGSRWRS